MLEKVREVVSNPHLYVRIKSEDVEAPEAQNSSSEPLLPVLQGDIELSQRQPPSPPPMSPTKQRKIVKAADMDDWLEDVICTGESQQPVGDVAMKEVDTYLAAILPGYQVLIVT